MHVCIFCSTLINSFVRFQEIFLILCLSPSVVWCLSTAHGYAPQYGYSQYATEPRYGYYPSHQGQFALGSFDLLSPSVIVVWIRQDETVVDGFVVPKKGGRNKGHYGGKGKARFVAKAMCVLGTCKPLDPSQNAVVELETGNGQYDSW